MHSIAWWPTLTVLAIATITDLHARRIPNWLVLPFLLGGVGVSAGLRGWSGFGHSVEGVIIGGGVFGVLFVMGGMGMGDVKLFAAIGAWIGPQQLLLALVLTGIAGGIMAIGWSIAGGFLGKLLEDTSDLIVGVAMRGLRPDPALNLNNPQKRSMPYAPAIAIGTLISFFSH